METSQGKISRNREEPGLRRGSHAPGSTARSSEGVHDPRVVRRVGPPALLGLVDEGVERVRDVRLLLRGGRFASSLAIDSDAACGSICVLVFCTQSGHSASTSLAASWPCSKSPKPEYSSSSMLVFDKIAVLQAQGVCY